MRIEILESREYRPFGFRYAGEQVDTDENVGKQLINQGFAREVKSDEKREVKYGTVRSKFKKSGHDGGN